MTPLKLSDVARSVGGRLLGPDAAVEGICTDSRQARPGMLFFALVGENADGHAYVPQALSSGAAAVVSEQWHAQGQGSSGSLVVVADPLQALGKLGASWRKQFDIPVVGITGSMGKTTTREMLAASLRGRVNVLVSPANFNTEIGVPLTLLDLTSEHQAAVIELAMRGSGQIAELCAIARPTAAVITNIGLTHLELLGSRDAIAAAKAELLEALPGQGWSVLNADDDFFGYLRERALGPVITFGTSALAQYRALDVTLGGDGCATFALQAQEKSLPVKLRVPGAFHVLNALAAAAAAARFGVSLEDMAAALESYEGFEKRTQLKASPRGWQVFDDTYNASPAATAGALDSLASMEAAGRRIAVLGDMRELGPQSEDLHREIGRKVAAVCPDALITVGESSIAIDEAALNAGYRGPVKHFADSNEAAEFAAAYVRPNDVVLVKGSRALEMERVVERLLA